MMIVGELIGAIDIKKFFSDKIEIVSICEHCEDQIIFELEKKQFSDNMNEKFKIALYCLKCDNEFTKDVFLQVNLLPVR